jgi:ABC-type sugar transport system substrate-binding protein
MCRDLRRRDQAKAQAATANLLAAEPEIDGIFVEDSMAMGVMRPAGGQPAGESHDR